MAIPASQSRASAFRSGWPWAGLCAALGFTWVAWFLVWKADRIRVQELQSARAQAMVEQVEGRMRALEQVLRGAAAYLGRGALPTRAEWRGYVAETGVITAFPGIQGIGFAEWIPWPELGAHTQRLRKEGFPEYEVKPGGLLPRDAEGCSSIIYLEPMDARNQRAFGRDMWAEATRREAMARARDMGLVALTGRVLLFQESATEVQAGTLLLAPVYRQGLPLGTVAQRRQAFRGWAYYPFRMSDLIRAALGRELDTMDLELFDGLGRGGYLLFDSGQGAGPSNHVAPLLRSFEVAGRTWTANLRPTPAFQGGMGRNNHWEVAAGGLIASLLLFLLLVAIQGAERKALFLADQRGEELLATESRFRALFEKAPLGMAILESLSGRYLAVNQSLADILGYSPEELLGKSHLSVTSPDGLSSALSDLRDLDSGEVTLYRKETRFLHRDGHTVLARLHVVRLPGPPSEATRHLSIVEDITEAKRREEELQDSEERFRGIFDLSPDPISLSRLSDGALLMVNEAWCKVTGMSRSEVLGLPSAAQGSWIRPGERERLMAELRRLGHIGLQETTIRRRDGTARQVLFTAKVITVHHEDLALVMAMDVTDRLRLEKDLQESEARFRMISENVGDVVWLLNLDSLRFEYVSPSAQQLLGKSPEEVLAEPLERVLPPDSLGRVQQLLAARLPAYREADPATWTFTDDIDQVRKDGTVFPSEITTRILADEKGRPSKIIGVSRDITKRRQAEEQLQRQILRHSLLMATSMDGIHVIDKQGRLREWNPAFLAHLGYSEEEAASLRVSDWDRQWTEAELLEEIARLIQHPRRFETVHRRKDGTLRTVEINATGIVLDGEELLYASARDVTEAVLAQEALEMSQLRYLALFDLSPDGISISRLGDGTLIEVNAAWEAMFGFSREEAVGRRTGELGVYAHPEDRQAFSGLMPEHGPLPMLTFDLLRKDGTPFTAELNSRVLDIGGERCLVAVLRDVTTSEALTRALQESEVRFRTVAEESPVALFIHREGRFVYLNPAAAALLRAPGPGALVGQPVLERIHPEDRAWVGLRMTTGPEQGPAAPLLEERVIALDGTILHAEVQARPITYDGQPAVLVFAMDITERKQSRDNELRARKAESLVLMAGGIAHDFNNLFQIIQSNLELAGARAKGDASIMHSLSQAMGVLNRAVSLSWRMLDFSGRGFVRLERLNLEGWLRELETVLGAELPPSFTLDLACDPVPFIQGDRAKLEEVLRAVLDNAREASGPEGGRVHLRLFVDFGKDRPGSNSPGIWSIDRPESPGTVCLEVADEGPGVPPDDLGLICDPFFTTKQPGRGLGLAAAVGILNAHRAGLHVFNGEGRGLVLRMHFPPSGA